MFLNLYFFFLGAIVGSFVNAVSYRLPKSISIVTPRSRCPKCGHQLAWYENIPLISFLIQKARCKNCFSNISLKYFLIEFVFGLYFMSFRFLIIKNTYELLLIYFIFTIFSLIVIIDLENKIIPDVLNLILAFILPLYTQSYLRPLQMILGGIIGFGVPFLITLIYYKISGKIGLGGGDIKLYGVIGLSLGYIGFISNLFLSCTLGAILLLILILFKVVDKNNPVPFGPFIIAILYFQIFNPIFINNLLASIY